MTEFAFSGLGINPHRGTPLSPWDRTGRRIPGGSSSGAAVSVADGMALAAIGTDTGGSCRIPAAFCGVVGWKPTARRVPLAGAVPLSSTLDSIGPLAPSVACCAAVDLVLSGQDPAPLAEAELTGLRLAVPTNLVLDGMDAGVEAAFERAIRRLDAAGALIEHRDFPQFEQVLAANRRGGFAAAEAHAWHRGLLAERAADYDPRVRARIETGASMLAADYVDLLAARQSIIAAIDAETEPYDALMLPTAPIVPPRLDDLADEAAYTRTNGLVLRNPSLVNFLDRCAISLPAHGVGEAPVGLMLVGETGRDRRLLAVAAAVEANLRKALDA